MTVRPFRVAVGDDVLDDLRERLRRTRFTPATDAAYWAAGTDPDYLRDLVAYWADGFDWRHVERELNTVPQFRTEIGGTDVHFAHVRAADPAADPIPLVLTHGWPSAYTEMLTLAERLADPAAHGLDPAICFDVVVPSLPGFVFSAPMAGPFTRTAVADRWHELMTRVLGYERFGVFGGDIGSAVSLRLAARYHESVIGSHTIHPPFPPSFDPPPTPEEQAFLDFEAEYDKGDGGYSEIMLTRPDTVAAALVDSPAGLAAWIVDKYRDWSDLSVAGGDLAGVWDADSLLTVCTLYWATGCIGTSFRQYYDFHANPPGEPLTAPVAVTLAHEPSMTGLPRSIAERAAPDLRHWSEPRRGGHFLAFEQPDLMAGELREFFGGLRRS